jgi:ATP-dependent DNA helicase RecG
VSVARKILTTPESASRLSLPVSSLGSAIKPSTLAQLERLGILTVRDLIRHYPTRYDDLRAPVRVADLSAAPPGEVNVLGIITQFKHVRLRGRIRSKSTALIEDGSGMLQAVWFGRPYLGTQLKPGMKIFVRGRIERTLTGPHMSVVQHRVVQTDEAFEGELEPVYPLTAGLQSRTLRRLIAKALPLALRDGVAKSELDPLPPHVNKAKRFKDARWALRAIHQPKDYDESDEARRRLIFEEFFLLAISTALRRAALKAEPAPDFGTAVDAAALAKVREEIRSILPFSLTGAQVRVIDEIFADLRRKAPMNRLLQGDVGSGKTAVAAAAVLLTARAKFQAAFMAPTEILATQQFNKLSAQLSHAGLRSALVIGGMRRRTRDDVLDQLRAGDLDVVVGTHALLTEDVAFANLGLVVIDEQHRFGVMQRAALRAKARGHTPHTLVMTATPIPRTLAQSVYADLDVSVIDELPPGRTPVKTFVRAVEAKPKIFDFVRDEIAKGRQAFVVCPAIEESERAVHSAEEEARRLQSEAFKGLRVALLHGKMTGQQKDEVMRLFVDGFIQVLIATTVVEVGVDIPNATVMVVLDAHVFGLAQLHQLRGRVGRGSGKSYCILVAPEDLEDVRRLEVLERTNDGFEIAEEDMKLRGAGDLGGIRQHGGDDFKLAHLIRDFSVFVEAKKSAEAVVAADPHLRLPENRGLAAHLAALDREVSIRATS